MPQEITVSDPNPNPTLTLTRTLTLTLTLTLNLNQEITVSGAGSAQVNGTYNLSTEMAGGAHMWTKADNSFAFYHYRNLWLIGNPAQRDTWAGDIYMAEGDVCSYIHCVQRTQIYIYKCPCDSKV